MSLAPLLLDQVPLQALSDDPILGAALIVVELLVGGMIGLLGRIFFLALETMAVGAATCSASPIRSASRSEPGETLAPLATVDHARRRRR